MRIASVSFVILASLSVVYACSSSSNNAPAATDLDGSADAPTKKEAAAADDSGEVRDAPLTFDDTDAHVQIRCTAAEYDLHDFSNVGDASVDALDPAVTTVVGPKTAEPSQYTPNCLKLKVNQRIKIDSNFNLHPILTEVKDGGAGTTTGGGGLTLGYFYPGEYGFECRLHPDTMYGAVKVVP